METADMYISGVGSYVPATVSVDDAVAAGRYTGEEVELHGLASVAVAGDVPAPEMALRAARSAVARSGRSPTDLDLLLYTSTWHQGPEGWPPQAYVQRHLVGDGVLSTQLKQGCNGMLTAFELAASFLRAAPGRRAALLVAADNYGTPLVDRWRMLPGAVAGDAGSAVVLDTEPGFARLASVCSVSVSQAEEMHRCAEPLFPPGILEGRAVDFAAHNDEFRRRAVVEGDGTRVLVTLDERMAEVIDQALAEAGVKPDDVTRVSCMNTSREIADQVCEMRLGVPASRSAWEFGRTIGHCGASDQVLALEHLVRTGGLGPGDHLLMFGFGPGVTISAAVVEVLESPIWARTRGGDA
ncbi:ketoacyl-ACP synthase III family protein [Actinoallomurus sp. NPDC052274]|uniref:ketoacyl-ACP synthase III family protein n=1 Tax=Actinoallomurus sp. NPDC052274 TaxID=3155420 RepID=UPI00341CEC52